MSAALPPASMPKGPARSKKAAVSPTRDAKGSGSASKPEAAGDAPTRATGKAARPAATTAVSATGKAVNAPRTHEAKPTTLGVKSATAPAPGDDGVAAARTAKRGEVDRHAVGLLEEFRQGDRTAFDRLVELMHPQVFRFLLRMVGNPDAAEDLTQDTFIRVFKSAADYQPRAKLSTWVLQIAKNLCFDYFKREALRAHHSLQTPLGEAITPLGDLLTDTKAVSPAIPLVEGEDVELLHRAIAQLAPLKREALLFRFFHELPYDEIAVITGSPSGTIKYRVHEAVQDLTALLSKSPNFKS